MAVRVEFSDIQDLLLLPIVYLGVVGKYIIFVGENMKTFTDNDSSTGAPSFSRLFSSPSFPRRMLNFDVRHSKAIDKLCRFVDIIAEEEIIIVAK